MQALGSLFLGLLVSTRLLGGGGGKGNESISTFYVANRTAPNAPIITVIPFRNLTEDTSADKKVQTCYMNHLLASGSFAVVDPSAVDKVLTDLRVRSDVDSDLAKQIGEKLNSPMLLVGTINEYGTPKVGSSQAISVALDARLVDTRVSQIVWAGSVAVSEQPKEPLFGPTQSPTLFGLTNKVVRKLVSSMVKEKQKIAKFAPRLEAPPAAGGAPVAGAGASANASAPAASTGRFLDEAKEYNAQDMQSLLIDLPGYKKDVVIYTKHVYDTVETSYTPNGTAVRVKLVDYKQAAVAESFVKEANGSASAETSKLEGRAAYSFTGSFQTYHLNVSVGRFGLFLRGPANDATAIKDVASRLIKSLT